MATSQSARRGTLVQVKVNAMATAVRNLLSNLDRGAWLRFMIALVGLCLAFLSALTSTVMREQGNQLGTILAASCALLMAGTVAIAVVPYLAQRVAIERVRHVLQYDITREGILYMLVALVIGIAALNTGNNLLFIILAAMLGAIVVSGIASALVLRSLKVELSLPNHVFAEKPLMARLQLRNTSALPSFSISVAPPRAKNKEKFAWKTERSRFGVPPKSPPHEQWFSIPDIALRRMPVTRVRERTIVRDSAYFAYLAGRSTQSQPMEVTFPRRGLYQQRALALSTRFPFSFLKKTRTVALDQEVVVYPSVAATAMMIEMLPTITGEFESFVAGRGNDLYRIRPYEPGDPARHIDWKATARTGNPMTREFSREDERKLRLVFDNPAAGVLDSEQYERSVQLAASMAWVFADAETELRFAGPGIANEITDIFDVLRYFAHVEPAGKEQASIFDRLPKTDDYNLIFTARPRGTVPTELWDHSYCIFLQEL